MPPGHLAMHCRSCTSHCPFALRQRVARVALPTTLRELQCPLPVGSVAVRCRSSTTRCPQAMWQCTARVALPAAPRCCGSSLQELHFPLPLGTEATRCTRCTAYCHQAVRHWLAGVAPPSARRRCGTVLQEFHTLGSDHLVGRTPRHPICCANTTPHHTTPHSRAVLQCIEGIPLPTASEQCGGVVKEMHCPLLVYRRHSIARGSPIVWQCIAGVPRPAAPRQCGNVLNEIRCPLPLLQHCGVVLQEQCPIPPSSVAAPQRSSIACYSSAVW